MTPKSILQKSSNWLQFKSLLSPVSANQKGEAFELLAKHYLKIDPKYATKLTDVWLYSEIPSNLFKKLNLPSRDQGIDLIAKTKEGEFWAIQCKYLEDETKSLTWRQLSTFAGLAFGICRNISFGLVCTSAEHFTSLLKDQDNIGFCTGEVWRELDEEFFRRARSLLRKRTPFVKPLRPRPHQRRAIKNAKEHFITNGESRGKLITPCGSGKSLAAYWIAEEFGAKRIVVAVPSLALIRQTLRVWLRETYAKKKDVDWICVCSDESAGRIRRDDLAVLKQDLGIPATTSPEIIARWLRKRHKGMAVVFTTYQSGKVLAEALKLARRNFDLGIMDEAHKTVGTRDKTFAHLLFDENIKIKIRVFMTATERRYAGKNDEIISMDDPHIYGETFDLMTFKEALEQEPPILSDYKIITLLVDKSEVAELIKENVFVKPDKEAWDDYVEAEMLASVVALRKAMKKYPIKHAVSFHRSIRRSQVFKHNQDVFSIAFPSYGKLETYHVSGRMSTSERDRFLREFETSRKSLITNARCLTEGVDVPNIDCVLFADPKKSTIDIVQAVGRGLRPAKGKKLGYVAVPILVEDERGEFLESEAFSTILMVLRALASNDERIIEFFRARANKKRNTSGITIHIDIDERIAKRIDAKEFVRSIELKCWNRLARLSWRPFEEAREYARSLEIGSSTEWFQFCRGEMFDKGRLPSDIPFTPYTIYMNQGWISWGDWLGTGRIAAQYREFLVYEEAKAVVHKLGLKSLKQWRMYSTGSLKHLGTRPSKIPGNPQESYRDNGWISWGDWLGTGRIAERYKEFLPYEEARKFVHGLQLRNEREWRLYRKGLLPNKIPKPGNIPSSPESVYKASGWSSMSDWLGTNRYHRQFRPFSEARKFVRSLGLKSSTEWREYCSGKLSENRVKPADIPSNPYLTYKSRGWAGMGDWLGTDRIQPGSIKYRDFQSAREFVRGLGLKSNKEWRIYSKEKRPLNIPANPDKAYEDLGWQGWGDWLGTGTVPTQKRTYRPFNDAKKFAQNLRLKRWDDWRSYVSGKLTYLKSLPSDIPRKPDHVYKNKGWKGWPDFLRYEFKDKKKESSDQK